jgi:glycosyltransferase involved in cell wall biosynthesis
MDYLVTVSKGLQKFYEKHLDSKSIYIGAPLDYFPDETSNLNNKEIISVGRLSKEKGFMDLIDVFEMVNKKHSDWKLNIVGDGAEKEKINSKIKQLNLEENIIMHGFKEKKELNEIYKNNSIYVMTSYKESFGLVLIEAMSFGIPCIAFDSAKGPLEIIDNKTGFIIKNRNKEEMANKIFELIENKDLRKKLGNNARGKSILYDKDKTKEEWEKLLNKRIK